MIEAAGPASGRDGLGRGAGRACNGDGTLRVGVGRHSPERTPHIRRVELGAALTGERRIVVHPLLADREPAGRAGGVDAREAHRCRAPAALRFGATFSARDHEPSPAKSIDAKSTTASQVCPRSPAALRCQPAIDLSAAGSASRRDPEPATHAAGLRSLTIEFVLGQRCPRHVLPRRRSRSWLAQRLLDGFLGSDQRRGGGRVDVVR